MTEGAGGLSRGNTPGLRDVRCKEHNRDERLSYMRAVRCDDGHDASEIATRTRKIDSGQQCGIQRSSHDVRTRCID
jgi:hypothetical protein